MPRALAGLDKDMDLDTTREKDSYEKAIESILHNARWFYF